MADGIEEAAQAFTTQIAAESKSPTPPRSPGGKSAPGPEAGGPVEAVFGNIGDHLESSEEKGGGDDDNPEDVIYGDQNKRAEADTGPPSKRKNKDSEGDDDESDGDDASGDEDDTGDDADDADDSDGDTNEEERSEAEEAFLRNKVEVTVDGEPVEVSVKEALEGYVRTQTFHRRMNQLDEAKKIVRKAAGDAVHNFEYSMNLAKEMEAHMETMIPKEPNWDEEFQKDPAKARELQKYYEKAKAFRDELRAKTADARKKMDESSANQLAAFVEEESQKFAHMNRKNWSDPKKKVKDLNSMRRTALAAGFSEDEVSSVYDSRMLQILLKASKFDRMMAAKPKPVVRQQGKPISPGTGSAKQRTVQRGVTSAMKRLNRTGSPEDAAVVFDQLIARG